MKRLLPITCVVLSTLSIAACGGSAQQSATTAAAGNAGGTKTEAKAEAPAAEVKFTYCTHNSSGWNDEALDLFAKRAEELSGGRIKGQGYTPGTMGTETELCDSVILGDLTVSTPTDPFILDNLGLDDWASLPGLMTSTEETYEYLINEGGHLSDLLNEQCEAGGLIRLAGMDNGFRCFATNEPVDTLADISKLKIRVSNAQGYIDLYAGIGALPTVIDSSEVMAALEQGTIDAVDNSLVNLANQGYIDMCDKVLAVNMISATRSIICNADWFNSLSSEDQAIIRQAAKEGADLANECFNKQIAELYEDTRWTIHELNDEQKAAFEESAQKVIDNAARTFDPAVIERLKKQ